MSEKELGQELEELKSEITDVHVIFTGLLDEIDAAKKAKVSAKSDYNLNFDRGDEDAMSECLRTIRECNDRIEGLQAQLKEFPSKISALYEKQKQLVTTARQELPQAENLLRQAQENLKVVEQKISQCSIILYNLNPLRDFVKDKSRALSVAQS